MVIGVLPIAECHNYMGFFFFFLRCMFLTESGCWEHTFLHKDVMSGVTGGACQPWSCVAGNMSLHPSWFSPMDRANIQNLGNFTNPQHCSRRQGNESEENLEKTQRLQESSQGAETSLRLAQPARTIRTPKCRRSGMIRTVIMYNIVCQLLSTLQAVRKSLRKCRLFFCPRCLVSVLAACWSRQHAPIWTKVINSFHLSHCRAPRTAATLKSRQLVLGR